MPDPQTYPGLLLAFQLAAEGRSDREVAEMLNAAGYRTTGNRGARPFSKDSVRRIILNRFYLGELPDGNGGWMPGAHQAVLDPALFDAAQAARLANLRRRDGRTHRAQIFSLSRVAVCGHCGGRIHIARDAKGHPRAYCYGRA